MKEFYGPDRTFWRSGKSVCEETSTLRTLYNERPTTVRDSVIAVEHIAELLIMMRNQRELSRRSGGGKA